LFSHYNGALRERLITNLLYNYRTNPQDLAFLIKDALSFVRKEDFKVILEKLQSSRIKGATAYNFSLPDSEGKMHTLSEYRGKAVFIDFWFTGCGNCVRIAPYLTEIEQHFKGKPVVFVSVNVDQDKQQWLRSIKSGKYSSKYVTNLYTNGLGLEHPICRYYNIDGYPTLILINKQGYLLNNPIDPRKDNGRNLISLINQEINN
jgi:thiol-disulfide isomerase/thioredoxin